MDNELELTSFKDICTRFLKENSFEPVFLTSEEEARKNFHVMTAEKKYPVHVFESDTSGEKKFEEFYTKDEDYDISTYNSLGFIDSAEIKISFKNVLVDFNHIFDNLNSNKSDIITVIRKYVPNFEHSETGKNLDQKM